MILAHAQNQREIEDIINKRINGWPLDKILGQKDFYKHSFFVNEDVLSPRPDTEILVEAALEIIQKSKIQNILDLGTGSGCILLSILKEFPHIQGVGVDISEKALTVADKNKSALGVDCKFIQKDWFKDNIIGEFDLIVSNPPYIPRQDISALEKEVREHDPMLALDGGVDGLDSYKKIAELSKNLLKKDGYILLEAGINQAQDIVNIFISEGLKLVEVKKDLSGINRCIILKK